MNRPISARIDKLVLIGNIGVASVMALRTMGDFKYFGFFKKRKGTLFATRDTWVYTPLCLVAGGGLVFLLTN